MTNLLGQLKALIEEAKGLITDSRLFPSVSDPTKVEHRQRVTRWMSNSESILQFAAIPTYLIKFHGVVRQTGDEYWKIARIAGLLESASDMLAAGLSGILNR